MEADGAVRGVRTGDGAFHAAPAVILAVAPAEAARIAGPIAPALQGAAETAIPVRAACLDLGLRALLRPSVPSEGPRVERASLGAIFRQGVVTNVLNPKVALFFLAFLPQFVDPARGSVPLQLLLLGVLFNVSGTLVNLAVAFAASGAGSWGRTRLGGSALLQRLTGGVFVGLGVRLSLQQRPG